MSVIPALSASGEELTIEVHGRFDFVFHKDFRNAYESLETPPLRYIIDLREVTYIDSSALGMLLLLRDFAGGDEADIKVIHCNEDVSKVLLISKFDQLFQVS